MNDEVTYLFTPIPHFDARGLRRCSVPGVGMNIGDWSSIASFWSKRDGNVVIRISWMGYDWSFKACRTTGEAISDSKEEMQELADAVYDELYRWMIEDAADLSPFVEW